MSNNKVRRFFVSSVDFLGGITGWIASKTLNRSGLFFFFPVIRIGGAEQVHLDIVSCFRKERPWVFIRRRTPSSFEAQYRECCKLIYLEFFIRPFPKLSDLWFSFWKHFFLSFINHHKSPTVFFWIEKYMKRFLMPHFRDRVKVIDIVHNLKPWDNEDDEFLCVSLANRINRRVLINPLLTTVLREVYKRNNLEPDLLNRLMVINNATDVPSRLVDKNYNGCLKILFIARPSIEKRIHLVDRVASICKMKALPCEFSFVGNIKEMISKDNVGNCRFYGEIVEKKKLNEIYADHHVIILTSQSEGFPMVFTEAMAYGVVPVTTNVGWISSHIKSNETGYLVRPLPEERCVREIVEVLSHLVNNREELQRVSIACFEYAKDNFRREIFELKYRKLLLESGSSDLCCGGM